MNADIAIGEQNAVIGAQKAGLTSQKFWRDMYSNLFKPNGRRGVDGLHVDEMLARSLGGKATWPYQMPLPGELNSYLGAMEQQAVRSAGLTPGTRILGIDLEWLR